MPSSAFQAMMEGDGTDVNGRDDAFDEAVERAEAASSDLIISNMEEDQPVPNVVEGMQTGVNPLMPSPGLVQQDELMEPSNEDGALDEDDLGDTDEEYEEEPDRLVDDESEEEEGPDRLVDDESEEEEEEEEEEDDPNDGDYDNRDHRLIDDPDTSDEELAADIEDFGDAGIAPVPQQPSNINQFQADMLPDQAALYNLPANIVFPTGWLEMGEYERSRRAGIWRNNAQLVQIGLRREGSA